MLDGLRRVSEREEVISVSRRDEKAKADYARGVLDANKKISPKMEPVLREVLAEKRVGSKSRVADSCEVRGKGRKK